MVDAFKKGRLRFYKHASGSEGNSATLTDDQVASIRMEYTNGATMKSLQEKYGHSNITRIVRNKCYHDDQYRPINGNAKPRPHRRSFNFKDVIEIEKSPVPSRKLAAQLGVSKTTILKIKNGGYRCL